jgi:hypothetical protein
MTARIKKQFSFSAGLVYQGHFIINHYTVTMALTVKSNDFYQQNIAYERMKYWMQEIMSDAILISEKDAKLKQYSALDTVVIALPQDPVDQLVGIMLYSKINAVMEDRIEIDELEIVSSQGDDTVYLYGAAEIIASGVTVSDWWFDARPNVTPAKVKPNGKVVNLTRTPEWDELGLAWDTESDTNSTVVFANFGANENK